MTDDAVKIMKQMWANAEQKSRTSYAAMGAVMLIVILYSLFILIKYNKGFVLNLFDLLGGIMVIPMLFLFLKNAIDASRSREEIHNLYLEMVVGNEKNETKRKKN